MFNVCSDVSEALLRVLRTLSVSCLLCLLRCFRGSLAGFTHFIRLSPVQSLLRCFRGSCIRFFALYCASLLGIYCQAALYRWEGMAASTNCSSNVNCCATLRTYLVHRERRSTMTEERNSNHPRSTTRHLADAHAPAYGITHIRACAMDRSRKLFRLFSRHISGKSPR